MGLVDWTKVKYFVPREFDSPDQIGSGQNMQREIIAPLDYIRTNLGRPIVVHSGYRTLYWNQRVGGVDASAHQRGYAVDVKAIHSHTRQQIVYYAMEIGINRIGIGRTFVHLDADPSLPAEVIWLYS